MNNIQQIYKGVRFASRFEAKLAQWFDENGYEWAYEPVRIPFVPKVRHYKPDFYVTSPDGESFYVEAKGFFDGASRAKMAQVKAQHSALDIRFVFMNSAMFINKASKERTTYAKWAEKYGFRCFDVDLPTGKVATECQDKNKPSKKTTVKKSSTRSRRGSTKA